MAYAGMAWPGLTLSIKAVNYQRATILRWIKSLDDNPKAYKRPTSLRMKWKAMLADLDTGLKVLRDAERAVQAPRRKRIPKPARPGLAIERSRILPT